MERHRNSTAETIDDRIRELLSSEFDGRGRFAEMEKQSGIPINRWKNFVYGKQKASPDMINFVCGRYPEEEKWVHTGMTHPEQSSFPFAATIPTTWDGQTVGDRLTWVIKEWASPKGERLFQYLEEKTHGKITASEWAQVILGRQQPSQEMIELVIGYRPHFFEWVMRGRVSNCIQVDPTDSLSIQTWVKDQEERTGRLFDSLKANGWTSSEDDKIQNS